MVAPGKSDLVPLVPVWHGGKWLNPPQTSIADDAGLHVVTDAGSDFWQETFYGFKRDSGHFYGFLLTRPLNRLFAV